MPQFLPFQALRYSPEISLADVCSAPYDVQSDADRAAFASRSEHNIVNIDLPVGDEPYLEAAKRFKSWQDSGVLVLDETPSFTLYRMKFTDSEGKTRQTVGIIGALKIEPPDSQEVLPHEQTTPKAKTDRLELTRATHANLSPIWGLSLTTGLTTALVEPGESLGAFTDENNVEHIVERISNKARCAVISKLISQSPVVIADGHHRYAISRTFSAEATNLAEANLVMCYINELVDEQLSVAAIHRLYSGTSYDDLKATLAKSFEISPIAKVSDTIISEMALNNHLTLIAIDGSGSVLTPKPQEFSGVRQLDSALLEHAMKNFEHEVSYQHGLSEVRQQLTTGKFSAAVLIRPVSVAEIQRTAHEGLLMPPKSTFFTPKLQTGLVIRSLR
ncbi:MAG: DUF1015 domain-containing protein [Actinobacteria bacterium]|nr:DUF1015 domain-containing protein [Actinomycetota bacterium]